MLGNHTSHDRAAFRSIAIMEITAMNSENTTAQASAATITEKELFAEFMESHFDEHDRLGRSINRRSVPRLLRPEGYYDYVDVDLQLRGNDDDPSHQLERIEEELSDILDGVRLARMAFDKLKCERQFWPEAPDEADTEAYAAWEAAYDEMEENPRYRTTVAAEVQEAA